MANLQNQHTTNNGITVPTDFNFDKTPEYMARLFAALGLEFKKSGEEYKLSCIYHTETKPSLFIFPKGLGSFYCHGCQQRGTLSDIVMKVCGLHSRKDALVFMAEINGTNSQYVDPDKNYIVYSYRDKQGFIKKQTLRHKYKEKSFIQRVPVGAGWKYTAGAPMLYNLDKLQVAVTVLFCEGERDCTTIDSKHLNYWLVATTTGGAGTWVDHLADDLVGKQIVLMPDNDPDGQGEKYADEVAASLTKRDIRFTRISFAEDGVKDVTEYLETHSVRALFGKIGSWFFLPPSSLLALVTY